MPLIAQVFLAVTITASTVGSFIALSPPNPSERSSKIDDGIHLLARKPSRVLLMAPFVLLSLHVCSLAYFYPNIPIAIYGYGEENRLNIGLITWSAATSIPLALILCVGVPIRLVSYASLGKNFTFDLAEPDRLVTDGIYRYLQHPSYTGALVLAICNTILLGRVDGALSCWIPPQWHQTVQNLWWWFVAPAGYSLFIFAAWTRMSQEESMMLTTFGAQWERWHATTARLIPWIF
ncbi:hypothetical protein P7C71_g6436, partial [Lecanoromycetidae sp. Uapishka_2]